MLIVVCGEDVVSARKVYLAQIEIYKKKGFRTRDIVSSDLESLHKSGTSEIDLFGTPEVYTIAKLSSAYKGRKVTPIKTAIVELAASKDIILIDWEEGKSAYDLSTLKKIASQFLENKPPASVFQLLDICVPGKLIPFVSLLRELDKTQEALFVYTLLYRHMRKLILAQENIFDAKTAPWQKAKLTAQARLWPSQKLLAFYEGLAKIDVGMKTSSNAFDMSKSLELLSCYYLI